MSQGQKGSKITESLLIGNKSVRNRIAFLAVKTPSLAESKNSYYGSAILEHYTNIAKGGAGLIIVQATNVSGVLTNEGKWTTGSRVFLKKTASSIRDEGSIAILQLSGDWKSTHPGAIDLATLAEKEILEKQHEIVAASMAAYEQGFDGVEFLFAHDTQLFHFVNQEHLQLEKFTGTLEARLSFITEIINILKQETGGKLILGVRMCAALPTTDDGIRMAKCLEEAGTDFLDITFGKDEPAHQRTDTHLLHPITLSAELIHKAVTIPVIATQGLKSGEQILQVINSGIADIAGVARGILADPYFVQHIVDGIPVTACLSCLKCKWYEDHTKCPARK